MEQAVSQGARPELVEGAEWFRLTTAIASCALATWGLCATCDVDPAEVLPLRYRRGSQTTEVLPSSPLEQTRLRPLSFEHCLKQSF